MLQTIEAVETVAVATELSVGKALAVAVNDNEHHE